MVAEINSGINNVKEVIWFEGKIYVIDDSPAVGVYSNSNPSKRYEQVDQITFMNRSDCPEDMILIKSIRTIVVHWGNSILKIRLPGSLGCWHVDGTVMNKFSITPSDQVLVVVKRGKSERCYLDIYKPSKSRFTFTKERILLSSKATFVSNVVQSSTGNYIFSCIENNDYLITEISADGKKIIRTVKPSHLSILNRIYFFNDGKYLELMHLCLLMNERDEIFITDRLEGKILLLDPHWTEFCTLISRIDQPCRLQYSQEEQQLTVATADARILTYKLA